MTIIPTPETSGEGSSTSPVETILTERARQKNLPGSEWDMRNSPNDWVAITDHYLSECVRRGANLPQVEEFRDSLIKAAAIILAAIEHIPVMEAQGHFRKH